MKKYTLLVLLICITSVYGQEANVGLRLESINYSAYNPVDKTSDFYINPMFTSGYLKYSLIFQKFEVEFKYGLQLGENFGGYEYAISFKYNVYKKWNPLLIYKRHSNSGDGRASAGVYTDDFSFVGIGFEYKVTRLLSLDMIYYKPLEEKFLFYTRDPFPYMITYNYQMSGMIKFSLILNIFL